LLPFTYYAEGWKGSGTLPYTERSISTGSWWRKLQSKLYEYHYEPVRGNLLQTILHEVLNQVGLLLWVKQMLLSAKLLRLVTTT